MAPSDLFYLALVATALVLDHFVFWRRFAGRPHIDPGTARLALWRTWIGMLWVLSLAAMALWVHHGRRWGLLGLVPPTGWRLWASAGLFLAVIALYAPTLAKLGRIAPARRAALRARFGSHAAMLPHTRPELAWFTALSLTAGFCEELVFRGYLVWVFQPFIGIWGAAAVSCVVFALAHSYQGAGGVLKTGLIGTVFMLAVLASGSLIPAIAIHALIDVAQGVVAWLVLREGPADSLDGVVDGGTIGQAPLKA
ncbi:MAG: CPBP family intramembrane metalloprotease [Lysobacter sp.]|nr:CPBP family intramembrane metalloprotease [Lysobacter sp.]